MTPEREAELRRGLHLADIPYTDRECDLLDLLAALDEARAQRDGWIRKRTDVEARIAEVAADRDAAVADAKMWRASWELNQDALGCGGADLHVRLRAAEDAADKLSAALDEARAQRDAALTGRAEGAWWCWTGDAWIRPLPGGQEIEVHRRWWLLREQPRAGASVGDEVAWGPGSIYTLRGNMILAEDEARRLGWLP